MMTTAWCKWQTSKQNSHSSLINNATYWIWVTPLILNIQRSSVFLLESTFFYLSGFVDSHLLTITRQELTLSRVRGGSNILYTTGNLANVVLILSNTWTNNSVKLLESENVIVVVVSDWKKAVHQGTDGSILMLKKAILSAFSHQSNQHRTQSILF